MPGDKADIVLIPRASRDSGDHFASNNDRARCVLVAELRVGDLGIPHKRSCSCVQRNDVRVSGCRKNFVAVNRNVSLYASSVTGSSVTLSKTGNSRLLSSTGGRRRTGDLWTVLPDQITSRGVQRLNDAARI